MIDEFKKQLNSATGQALKTALGIFLLSCFGYQLIVFANSSISQNISVVEFGRYGLLIKSMHYLSHFVLLGQDSALFYYIGRYKQRQEPQALYGYLKWLARSQILRFMLMIVIGYLLLFDDQIAFIHFLSLWVIPLICLNTLLDKYLLYSKAYLRSFFPRCVLQAAVFTLFILILLEQNIPLTLSTILLAYGGSFFCCLLTYLYFISAFPLKIAKPARYHEKRAWRIDSFHFGLTNLIITNSRTMIYLALANYALWQPSFDLPVNPYALGYLNAVIIITFNYHLYTKAIEVYLKPLIAHHMHDAPKELQKHIVISNRIRHLIVWSISLHIFYSAENLLAAFGPDYQSALYELLFCTVCYHVYTLAQPAIDVLVYGGQQKIVSRILQLKMLLSALLTYCLIPYYGLLGAVTADALPAALGALSAAAWVRYKLNIRALALL